MQNNIEAKIASLSKHFYRRLAEIESKLEALADTAFNYEYEFEGKVDAKVEVACDGIRCLIAAVTETLSTKVGKKIMNLEEQVCKLQGLDEDKRSEPPSEPVATGG